MIPSLLRSVAPAMLSGLILWCGPAAAQESQTFAVNEENGSTVEVTHVFSAVPPGGYTALRVTVINKGRDAVTLKLSPESRTAADSSEHTLRGPAQDLICNPEATTSREIIVPLMTDFSERRSYLDNSLTLGLSLPGRSYQAAFRTSPLGDMPFWGVSQGLGGPAAAGLNDEANKAAGSSGSSYGGGPRFAAVFLPAHLPSEWRAYTGLDGLALNADEWNGLQPGVRTAIRQWVMMGGTLDLYYNGAEPAGILQEIKAEAGRGGSHALGAGFVRPAVWSGMPLGAAELTRFKQGAEVGSRHEAARIALEKKRSPYQGAMLPEAMGTRSFAAWQVGIILLIFGILVGPVNLFYLAAPGRRHRLFFTTPLIALGASVVLIAVIFLQDGAGGKGRRAALMELYPDENLAAIRQYQISRTGVLFGGGFVMDEPAVLTPLMMDSSRWTRLKPVGSRESDGQSYHLPEPQAYAGDWFQSRSEQAQLVETLRPGRGRVELKPGGDAPVLTSSLAGTLTQVFYQDPVGTWWAGTTPLATGGTITLQPSTGADFASWLEEGSKLFPPADREALDARSHRGRFYALSQDPGLGLVGTFKSIAWEGDHTLVHGRLAPAP